MCIPCTDLDCQAWNFHLLSYLTSPILYVNIKKYVYPNMQTYFLINDSFIKNCLKIFLIYYQQIDLYTWFLFFYLFYTLYVCTHTLTPQSNPCRGKKTTLCSHSLLLKCEIWGYSSGANLGSKCLYSLSHSTDPVHIFYIPIHLRWHKTLLGKREPWVADFKKPWLILLIHYGILITLTRNVKQTEMTCSSHLAIMWKKRMGGTSYPMSRPYDTESTFKDLLWV